jgi:hypothetical protein
MSPGDIINQPPSPKVFDYPGTMAVVIGTVFTAALLFIAGKFDPTGGVLTISLLIVLAFFGVVAVSMFYTIPTDEATSIVIGGLVAAFGAVIAFWLGKGSKP